MMILVRAIKDVTKIQQVKDSPTEQIRWDDNSYFSRLLNASIMSINKKSHIIACYKLKLAWTDRLWMTPWHIKYNAFSMDDLQTASVSPDIITRLFIAFNLCYEFSIFPQCSLREKD